jgi:tetratricopeptide (TPR) repeat protein
MQTRHLRIATGVALSVWLFAVNVRAQSTPDDAQAARAHLENADRAYREGRYQDAATSFLAADRLQPTPAVQLALGKTYEQLNEPSRALASYREYFVRAPRAPDRAQVQTRVAALALQLAERGVQQISVNSVPAGATVVIDTKPLGTTPIYIDLAPGKHHLEFHRKGYESASLDFELSTQQPLNVMTSLIEAREGSPQAANADASAASATAATAAQSVTQQENASSEETQAPAGATEPSPPANPQRDATTNLLRGIGFGALGGSVLTLGTAVAFELMRSHSESRARQQRQQIAFKDAIDTMNSQQTVARVFAVSAGVLAAAGGVLLVLAAERTESAPNRGGVAVACSPTACGAAYQGQF